jgi:tetratricopeptide (TPR) repeat protein/energy-coupling factor transporter ATP-binding protein EcfA2
MVEHQKKRPDPKSRETIEPLNGDPRRQAVDPLRGYAYQIWHSVYAWLELSSAEVLFLEGAEDFDVVSLEKATAVQVKDTIGNITLRSDAVIDAINHFWQLRKAHPEKTIQFRFLTRSGIGLEKGHPFGASLAGLTLWEHCSREPENIDKLQQFLLKTERLQKDIKEFLSGADRQTVFERLIKPIFWETHSRESSYVEEAIRRRLVLLGENFGVIPSEAEKVKSRLFKEALTTATKRDNRVLDRVLLLEYFEEETIKHIPSQQYNALLQVAQSVSPLFAGLVPSTGEVSFQPGSIITNTIPPLLSPVAKRGQLVKELGLQLKGSGILALTGSSGMGKTTLAKTIAQAEGGCWYWLNLTKHNPFQINQLLKQCAAIIDVEQKPISLILDDIDLSPENTHLYEDYLGGLLFTILQSSGEIIITSQKSLPILLSNRLGISANSQQVVPAFSEREIADFAEQMGCADSKLAANWAKIVLLHTKGHPQLIHARLINLASNHWPWPKQDDLITTPEDVIRERSQSRQLLDQLPSEQRDLIYRLSLVGGLFRRDHALSIGAILPPLKFPGDVFDRLVGPWIESFGGNYYRLSPLLDNAAQQVWNNAELQATRTDVGWAIMKSDNPTTIEARTVFLLALASRNSALLGKVVIGLLTAPEAVWKDIVQDLSWIIHLGIDPNRAIFPEQTFVNYMLRMLQFRIAVDVDPKTALLIAEAWDKEAVPYEPIAAYNLERFMLVGQALLYYQVAFPPRKLLALLEEASELEGQVLDLLTIDKKILKNEVPLGLELQGAKGLVDFLILFFIPRCTGIPFLEELLDGLQEIAGPVRERLLRVFITSDVNSTMLIDRAWVEESKRAQPEWEACIKVLEKTVTLALQWGATSLAIAAVRGMAIVYEEYLKQPIKAVNVLDQYAAQAGMSDFIIKDEMATILFHQKKYDRAFKIWADILPEWHYSRNDIYAAFIFSYRKAGMSAAELGEWEKAADFFRMGSDYARATTLQATMVGYLGDAGFALWKAGKYAEAIEVFAEALQNVESLEDPEKSPASFAVRKLLGHNLLWIEHKLSGRPLEALAEPFPGMCSNPDRNEDITKLPLTPLGISWLYLAQIEYHLRLGNEVFECVQRRFNASHYPAIGYMMAILSIKHAFLQLSFDDLPRQHAAFFTAYNASRVYFEEVKRPWDKVEIKESRTSMALLDPATGGEDLFISVLFTLSSANKLSPEIFQAWRERVRDFSDYEIAIEWINMAEKILFGGARECIAIMMNNTETKGRRLIASIRIGIAAEEVSPNELFYAHIMLASFFLQSVWGESVFNTMAELFARLWQARTNFRAVLLMPRVTVPEIQAACSAGGSGKKKATSILLAAANAVSISVPQNILDLLRNSANG